MTTVGKHDFDGQCRPKIKYHFDSLRTFSVGCFEILQRKDGRGTKRSGVKVRVRGYVSNPEAVYARAREICAQLDAGTYSGPKTVTVRS